MYEFWTEDNLVCCHVPVIIITIYHKDAVAEVSTVN